MYLRQCIKYFVFILLCDIGSGHLQETRDVPLDIPATENNDSYETVKFTDTSLTSNQNKVSHVKEKEAVSANVIVGSEVEETNGGNVRVRRTVNTTYGHLYPQLPQYGSTNNYNQAGNSQHPNPYTGSSQYPQNINSQYPSYQPQYPGQGSHYNQDNSKYATTQLPNQYPQNGYPSHNPGHGLNDPYGQRSNQSQFPGTSPYFGHNYGHNSSSITSGQNPYPSGYNQNNTQKNYGQGTNSNNFNQNPYSSNSYNSNSFNSTQHGQNPNTRPAQNPYYNSRINTQNSFNNTQQNYGQRPSTQYPLNPYNQNSLNNSQQQHGQHSSYPYPGSYPSNSFNQNSYNNSQQHQGQHSSYPYPSKSFNQNSFNNSQPYGQNADAYKPGQNPSYPSGSQYPGTNPYSSNSYNSNSFNNTPQQGSQYPGQNPYNQNSFNTNPHQGSTPNVQHPNNDYQNKNFHYPANSTTSNNYNNNNPNKYSGASLSYA